MMTPSPKRLKIVFRPWFTADHIVNVTEWGIVDGCLRHCWAGGLWVYYPLTSILYFAEIGYGE
jgi:hypothetical protein